MAAPVAAARNCVIVPSSAALTRTAKPLPLKTGPFNGLSRVNVITGGWFSCTVAVSSRSGPSLAKRSMAIPRNTTLPEAGRVNGISNTSPGVVATVTALALRR